MNGSTAPWRFMFPLIWYAEGRYRALSRHALQIFQAAARGRALIYIPTVVLWEVSLLLKAARTHLSSPFEKWATALLPHKGFDATPLDLDVIIEAGHLTQFKDPFDAAIVATARL